MLPRSTLDINPADLSLLMSESEDERARQRAIVRARDFHGGRQFVRLTERLRSFLKDMPGGEDSDYLRLNICRTVVQAVVERLIVRGFTSPDDALAAFAQAVWERSGGDVAQDDAHELATRDGEAFVLVDWDAAASMPRLVVHPRYVDAALDDPLGTQFGDDATRAALAEYWTPGDGILSGQGYGCVAHYPDDDLGREPTHVTKRWQETYTDPRGARRVRQRLTVYYPDRVEKYELTPQRRPIEDEGDAGWPVPLIAPDGAPLGIPVVHLRNAGLACEAWEAIPLQNAINKQLVDLLAAGDLTAFRIMFASGWLPTTDGKAPNGRNSLPVNPGQWVGSQSPDAKLQSVEGADLENLMAPIERLIQWAAMVTDTPVSRFTITRQVAGAETIKGQEGPLVNKVRKRQTLHGQGWARAMQLAARMAAVYAPQALAGANPAAELYAEWAPAETRDEIEVLNGLKLKREALDIPVTQLWREAGYTEAEIDQMLRDRERLTPPALQAIPTPTAGGTPPDEETDPDE